MNVNLYSIYDTVAQVFNKPFTEINDNSARRTFTHSLEQVPHKTDYALYYIGCYSDQDGKLVPVDNPVRIYSGFDIKDIEEGELPAALKKQA